MKIKTITKFDANGIPVISQEELYDVRDNPDPLAKQIFNALLSDDVDFISNEIKYKRLNINDYIFSWGDEETAIPLIKFVICGVSYKIAKYLLSFDDINVNAYGSDGANTLLGLCAMPSGYWVEACLSSSSRKELVMMLVNNPQIKLDAVKYDFNFTTGSYISTEQTAKDIASKCHNEFMFEIITSKSNNQEVPTDLVRKDLVCMYEQTRQLMNQEQQRLKSIMSSANLPPELALFKKTMEEVQQSVKKLRLQNS